MANPTCAPYTDIPLYVNRSAGETDEDMLAAVQRQAAKDVRGNYNNTDAKNAERITGYLSRMTGLQMPGLESYVDSALKTIDNMKGDRNNAARRMQVIAATEIVWQRRGAAVKQLARNYLAQKGEGQQAIAQAFEFLSQLKSFNRLGQKIAGENYEIGSALRQKLIAKGKGEGVTFAGQFGVDTNRIPVMDQQVAENLGKNLDAFDEIAEQINSGDLQGGLDKVMKVAKQIDMIEDPRDVAGVVSRWKSTWNTWDEVWINGLLSSPATFVVNVTSIAWAFMRPMLQGGAAKLFAESGIGNEQWTKAANTAAAEAGAHLSAMYASFQDAAMLGWMAAKTERSLFVDTAQAGGLDHRRITAKAIRANNILGAGRLAPSEEIDNAIDLVGQIVRLPSRSMLGMDEFTKVMALRGEVAAEGVRRAVRDGVDPTNKAKLQEYINEEISLAFDTKAGTLRERYAFDPSSADDVDARALQYQLRAQADGGRNVMDRARAATFQESNPVAKGINNTINKYAPLRAVMKPFIPFVTTPTNILKQGLVESTPIGPLNNARKIAIDNKFNPVSTYKEIQATLLNDPSETFRVSGQIAFMTLVGGMAYGMAMDGRLTGGGPAQWMGAGRDARKAQEAWLAAGNVPYSLDVGGGIRIPLGRLGEPFATPLRMIADYGMYSGYLDRTQQDRTFAEIASLMSGGIFEASFLSGLDDFMRIVQSFNGDGDALNYELGRGAQNWVATQTPFGGLLGFVDRLNNPYKAAYEGATFTEMARFWEVELGKSVFGKAANKIPGVETNPLLVDQITGKPVPIVPGFGPQGMNPLMQAVPFFPRQNNADVVWDAIYEIQGSYTQKSLSAGLKPTEQEQQQFNELMSSVKINGKTVAQAILEFRRRADVIEYIAKSGVTMQNSGIKSEFNKLLNRYRNRAQNWMLANNPNLMARRNTEEAMNYAASVNDIATVKELELQLEELVQRARKGY